LTGTGGNLTRTASFTLTVTVIAPFRLSLSTSQISLSPGQQTEFTATVTSTSGNLPSGNVFLSLSDLSANSGLELYQVGTQTVTPTAVSQEFSLTADPDAQPLQNFTVDVTAALGTDTSLSSVQLSVTNTFSSATTLPRSTFVPAGADVTRAVYDPARKLVFASVDLLNEVLVCSSTDGTLVATIPVDRPSGIDGAPTARNWQPEIRAGWFQ